MLYKGWVPTVVGHLSFTSFGDTEYPTKSVRFGKWDRFSIVQHRSLLDATFPLPAFGRFGIWFRERLTRLLFGLSGDFYFVMIGDWVDRENELRGYVFAIPKIDFAKNPEEFRVKLANLPQGPNFSSTHSEDFRDYIYSKAMASCRFSLKRSGEALIDTANDLGDLQSREIDYLFASQFYYFLKDCFHKHQHHDPTHDAIVPLFRVYNLEDTEWIKKTQFRMFRHIVRFKRFRDQKTLYRASGVLAYAQAFEKNFKFSNQTQKFRTIELEKSLSIRRDEIQHNDQLRISRQQAGISWFFSLTAFLISIIILAQLDREFTIVPSPVVSASASALGTYPGGAVAVVWLVSRTLQIFAFRHRPYEWAFVRNLYQLFRGSALSSFVSVVCVIGLFLIALAILIAAFVLL